MAKQGVRIPDHIRLFIVETKQNAPDLKARQIADRVSEKYGEANKVDRTSVSRIIKGVDVPLPSQRGSLEGPHVMERHRELLVEPMLGVHGIEPMALRDYDLAVWWSRPESLRWPIPKGYACRNEDSSVQVTLDAVTKLETDYLRQHLLDDPVWPAIDSCQEALAADIAARMALLEEVVNKIQRPVEQGGTGLKVIGEMGFGGSPEPAVSLRYAFTIFHQSLSRALGADLATHSRQAFRSEAPGVTDLAGDPVISSTEPTDHETAIELALRAQTDWAAIPQAQEAAKTFRIAEGLTDQLSDRVNILRLKTRLPRGSTCPGCDG